ncbi:sigma 54-interacting transcriptional regulator [Desulfobacula sp.]|uniref:sigma-54-dependent transcriptional regulator n=1 Tax=Desulfobacula sp. TaxID=2593537 RepID=UPI00261A10AD|nr:sigma 54-interacting transcriptional regulator [Desulfobacula sp.]
MNIEKGNILNESDFVFFTKCMTKAKDCKLDEYSSFLSEVLKNYDVFNCPLEDFLEKTDDKESISIPAVLALKKMFKNIINNKEIKHNDSIYGEYILYLENQGKRFSEYFKSLGSKEEQYNMREAGIIVYTDLLSIYTLQKDNINFSRVFKTICFQTRKVKSAVKKNKITISDESILDNSISSLTKYIVQNINMYVNNPLLQKSIEKAVMYADDSDPCLLIGATGTGKELLVRLIKEFSPSYGQSFRAVNCAGITESLFDSEINGAVRGAGSNSSERLGVFLSACSNNRDSKVGYGISKTGKIIFESGRQDNKPPTKEDLKEARGIVFLDEINSLPLYQQAKILRIIQEKEVEVVGADQPIKVDVKIICAANEINDIRNPGKFRPDLFYRISVGIIELPTLVDMKDSILDFAEYKIEEICIKLGYKKKFTLSDKAKKKLKKHNWPGNHRELENVLSRAIKDVKFKGEKTIKIQNLDFFHSPSKKRDLGSIFFEGKTFKDVENEYYLYLKRKSKGNKSKMQQIGGYSCRTPVYTLIQKYDS